MMIHSILVIVWGGGGRITAPRCTLRSRMMMDPEACSLGNVFDFYVLRDQFRCVNSGSTNSAYFYL